jgi:diguanylate cyclase (GGDEF)-like protein
MVLDLDRLKQINDSYGHAVGDEAIKILATTLKTIIRASDVPVRFGGDEFVVFMPETNIDQAIKLAQRLRLSLAENPIHTGQNPLFLTLSIGVAGLSHNVDSIDKLLENADRALYLAKQKGRNQVQSYSKA